MNSQGNGKPALTALPSSRTSTEEWVFAAVLFLGSTAIICLTASAAVISAWVGCWIFALAWSSNRRGSAAFLFVLAVAIFYPDESTAFLGFHEKSLVLSMSIILCALWYSPIAFRRLRGSHATGVLVMAWMAWGMLAYIPVALAWLWATIGSPGLPDVLVGLQHDTSGIKTAAPIISAGLVASLAVVALRDRRDFRQLRRAMEVAVIVLVTVSLAEWVLGRHFVPVNPDWLIPDTTRLEGFSTIDSNSFGRLLLFPSLLFVSAALSARSVGRQAWLALGLALGGVVLTQSRTSYISLASGLLVLGTLNLKKIRLWMFLGASAAWIALIAAWANLGQYFSKGSERLTLTNFILRVELWRGVLRIVRGNPWFGAHPSGYVGMMRKLGLMTDQINSAHSMYLAIGAEWGVPMVALAVAAILLSARHGWRALRVGRRDPRLLETRIFAQAVVASAIAYAVHGIDEVVGPFTLFLLLGLGYAARSHAEAVGALRSRKEVLRPDPARGGAVAARAGAM